MLSLGPPASSVPCPYQSSVSLCPRNIFQGNHGSETWLTHSPMLWDFAPGLLVHIRACICQLSSSAPWCWQWEWVQIGSEGEWTLNGKSALNALHCCQAWKHWTGSQVLEVAGLGGKHGKVRSEMIVFKQQLCVHKEVSFPYLKLIMVL